VSLMDNNYCMWCNSAASVCGHGDSHGRRAR
jgi:hypothetical protein